jgi:hypothetical protein
LGRISVGMVRGEGGQSSARAKEKGLAGIM